MIIQKLSYFSWLYSSKWGIIKIGNDNSVRYGFARECFNKPFTLSKVEWFIFYLCSCLLTQFLYRTDIKATFNVKDNINDIMKNSITLTINTTRLSYDESYNIGWQNRSTNYQFPMPLFYNIIFTLSIYFIKLLDVFWKFF